MSERLTELIDEIRSAFADVSRGEGISLHQAKAIDERKSPEHQLAERRRDIEKCWQDIPCEEIIECESALSFFDPAGFRYYLPAFMLCGLNSHQPIFEEILHSCTFHLLKESEVSLRESEPARIAINFGFSTAQCRAIAKFLRFVVGPDDVNSREGPTTLRAVAKWEEFVS